MTTTKIAALEVVTTPSQFINGAVFPRVKLTSERRNNIDKIGKINVLKHTGLTI
jgi:hypothetical protein